MMKEIAHQAALGWVGALTLFAWLGLAGKGGGPVTPRTAEAGEREDTIMNRIEELDKNTTVLANAVAKSVRNINDIAAMLESFDDYPPAVRSAILERIAGINSRFREDDMKVMIASLNEVVRIAGELVAEEPIPKEPQPEAPAPEVPQGGTQDPPEREAK